MDWTTPLRYQQTDFVKRLKSNLSVLSHLTSSEAKGYHSELTIISGTELSGVRQFCWHMVDRYRNRDQRPSSEIFINNMKGKLGELVIEKYLDQLITPLDLEQKSYGDGGIDFRLNADPSVGIQVKACHGSVDNVQWSISKDEIEKNTVLACILIQEEINESQDKYSLILAGFLPTDLIKESINRQSVQVKGSKAFLKITDLLYSGGLRSYLELASFTKKGSAVGSVGKPSASPDKSSTILKGSAWYHALSMEEFLRLEAFIQKIKESQSNISSEVISNLKVSIDFQIGLEALWQDVVKNIEPPFTQKLLGQQCRLVAFDGSSACISVPAAPFLKMAQVRMPNIEAAFSQCLGAPIAVHIVVEDSE